MQFFSLAIVAFLAANVHATCYGTGITGEAANIDPLMQTICTGLIGTYVQNEKRYQCAMDSAGVQWNFVLKYIGSGATRSIASPECLSGMEKQTSCSRGGDQSYANWEYTADPNAGTCYSSTY